MAVLFIKYSGKYSVQLYLVQKTNYVTTVSRLLCKIGLRTIKNIAVIGNGLHVTLGGTILYRLRCTRLGTIKLPTLCRECIINRSINLKNKNIVLELLYLIDFY